MTGGNTTGSFLRVQGICLCKRGLGLGEAQSTENTVKSS